MKQTPLIILLKRQSVLYSSVAFLFGHYQVFILLICILIENTLNNNCVLQCPCVFIICSYMISGYNACGLCKCLYGQASKNLVNSLKI